MQMSKSRRDLLRLGAGLASGGAVVGALGSADAEEPVAAVGEPAQKIASVKTYLLSHRLKRAFGASVSVPLGRTRTALLVKIETDKGLVGWGETSPIGGTRGAIEDHLGKRLIGQNPLGYRRLWRELWGPNFGNGLAVGGLAMALDDLRGKVLGLPVAELYGGRLRERVPVYVSAMSYVEGTEPEELYPAEAAALVKQGFKALKMRIGRYRVSREAAVAARVRDAVGPDIALMADGNGGYTMANALRMGQALHELGFAFFEEPLPQSPKYAGYEELRRKLPLPLAAGEVVDSRATAKELIDRRAMDIIQPDISLCGGISVALFIAELAALSGIRCIPHCWGGDVVIAATAHLAALLPDPHWGLDNDTPRLELDQSENPWRNGLAKNPIEVRDGFAHLPKGPGLGVEVDEEVVMQYAV